MFELRPYQSQIIADTREALRHHRSVLIQSATGSGKTNLASYMIGRAAERGKRAWFICHRDFLLTQTAATFDNLGIRYGYIAAGREWNPYRAVQIASVGTLNRRLRRIPVECRPDIIVWDECHHLGASSWHTIYRWAEGSRHIGLSATPQRLDGRGLDDCFGQIVRGPSVRWLIDNKYLSRYRAYAPSTPDLRGVHTRAGDYAADELSAVMDSSTIIGDVVGHYKRLANGKRSIYYAVSVEHSKHLAASFCASGVAARHLDASSSSVERLSVAQQMASGTIRVACNVDLFGEGFDLSAQTGTDLPIEAVGLCRPTQSLALHLQQVGRALRPKPDAAIILDHAGNLMRHGLPDDEREWSLNGRDKKAAKGATGPPVRQCPQCFGVHAASLTACLYCGHVYRVEGRQVDEVAGELAEIDPNVLRYRKRTEQARAETLEDLLAVARRRGYSPGWARHVMAARERRRA